MNKVLERIKNRVVLHLGLGAEPQWINIVGFNNIAMRLLVTARYGVEASQMESGTYDRLALKALLEAVPNEKICVWDIGAHIGYDSLMMASHSCVGTIVAFEPNPGNFERLVQNVRSNPDLRKTIVLRQVALGARSEQRDFFLSSDPNSASSTGGYLSGVTPPLSPASYKDFVVASCTTRRGVDVIAEDERLVPHCMKIDVEGGELEVLQGCEAILTAHRPLLLVELHSVRLALACTTFLAGLGYRLVDTVDDFEDSSRGQALFAYRKSVVDAY